MRTVSIDEAKTRLSKLVDAVAPRRGNRDCKGWETSRHAGAYAGTKTYPAAWCDEREDKDR